MWLHHFQQRPTLYHMAVYLTVEENFLQLQESMLMSTEYGQGDSAFQLYRVFHVCILKSYLSYLVVNTTIWRSDTIHISYTCEF
jgi:hypothetical protein